MQHNTQSKLPAAVKQVSLRVFSILALLFWPACLAHADEPRAVIPIMLVESTTTAEQLAARDLESALQRLYPREKSAIMDRLPDAGRGILLGSIAADEIRKRDASVLPSAAEGHVVTTVSGSSTSRHEVVTPRKFPLSASESTSFARSESRTVPSSGTTRSLWTRAARWM